ncbi:4'-phosphopantetheinyl transferase superfamily protein [Clostridiaceae bacterium OttesenSCG-928-D20]|nr:4'-phosphopantetheinyl transferase superfamily protein [Clostridiaceae bacterium OttesenSCG-928-D20]
MRVLLYEYDGSLPTMLVEKWQALMPLSRREKAEKFLNKNAKTQSVLAFCLLSIALGYIPGDFSLSPSGKPSIPGEIEFSISHSGRFIAAAASNYPIGIDIETLDREPNFKILNRFFTEEELIDWERSTDKKREFFRLWTKRESLIKREGGSVFWSRESYAAALKKAPGFQRFFTEEYELSVCSGEAAELVCLSNLELSDEMERLIEKTL